MLPAAVEQELAALQRDFGYGIRGRITAAPQSESSAHATRFQLTTLEGVQVLVELSNRGFQVIEATAAAGQCLDSDTSAVIATVCDDAANGHVYEGMEALLMTISPGFCTQFHQRLYAKLTTLSDV
ncbi:hypothetical protein THASP1DRAFT_32874 [Thamnocephalis sphaerospora]|uniref:GSKIP domain-containing protein n=1 Tax=Thamnocephalis sphaerospora TaxID=78915 RepID=A0A4V1IVU6_9FUNG|nr:hypothetical protein THASP1DRAFT_32874 [Thamnocephalis sphaerospora]|eukprot:RKP05289.1 hypothetical protein THASP1DRAFT_32874 [Thamnocephalis sphaerospora]